MDAPAAVYVLTSEDIMRSGATSIPEALRLVPGVDVARVNANSWAISVRGFNGTLDDKLLVLIDGRTVYDPLFSGVYWDIQDAVLEDIDRIEVIRGPGASLWGANAVNGVINIITKKAGDTQGALASATGGNQDGVAEERYGGKLGDNGYYRVYAKYLTTRGDEQTLPAATDAHDAPRPGKPAAASAPTGRAPAMPRMILLFRAICMTAARASTGSNVEAFSLPGPFSPLAAGGYSTRMAATYALGALERVRFPKIPNSRCKAMSISLRATSWCLKTSARRSISTRNMNCRRWIAIKSSSAAATAIALTA